MAKVIDNSHLALAGIQILSDLIIMKVKMARRKAVLGVPGRTGYSLYRSGSTYMYEVPGDLEGVGTKQNKKIMKANLCH